MKILEGVANVWSPPLYFLNFTCFLPNKIRYEIMDKDNRADGISSFLLFVSWSVVYYAYKTFLNSILRRMRYPMVKRNRSIDGLWCCGFSICSMIFLIYFMSNMQDCPWRRNSDYRLGFLIHKTFYLHRASIEIFVQRRWLKGLSDQLFALAIPIPSLQKWPEALVALLFYKASDMTLSSLCRLLTTLSKRELVKRVTKFIFILYFFNRIYIHALLVPESLMFDANSKGNLNTRASMWMWVICELLYSLRYQEFACLYSKRSLEMSLFPPRSPEVVEFAKILKKHRSRIRTCNESDMGETTARKQKTELWQTIVCAMAMKKRLKKLRISKERETTEEAVNLAEE